LLFEFEMDSNVPILILSDPNKIKNVLLNILGNSIKYSDKGIVKIKISLKDIEELGIFEEQTFQHQD
jgi:signal transduction histidine kinase